MTVSAVIFVLYECLNMKNYFRKRIFRARIEKNAASTHFLLSLCVKPFFDTLFLDSCKFHWNLLKGFNPTQYIQPLKTVPLKTAGVCEGFAANSAASTAKNQTQEIVEIPPELVFTVNSAMRASENRTMKIPEISPQLAKYLMHIPCV